MRLVIDHSNCEHGGAYADRCLALAMLYPLGRDRACMAFSEDDGKEELSVTLRDDDQELTLRLEGEDQVRAAAFEGWLAFETAPEG